MEAAKAPCGDGGVRRSAQTTSGRFLPVEPSSRCPSMFVARRAIRGHRAERTSRQATCTASIEGVKFIHRSSRETPLARRYRFLRVRSRRASRWSTLGPHRIGSKCRARRAGLAGGSAFSFCARHWRAAKLAPEKPPARRTKRCPVDGILVASERAARRALSYGEQRRKNETVEAARATAWRRRL
jgi:hypothetical protein